MFKEIGIYSFSLNKIQTPFLTFTSALLKLSSRFFYFTLFKAPTWACFCGSRQKVGKHSDLTYGYLVGLNFLVSFDGKSEQVTLVDQWNKSGSGTYYM